MKLRPPPEKKSKPARDGVDGRDGNDGEKGAAGENGQDGRSVSVADVLPVILETIHREVSGIPPPANGKDGINGADGKDGAAGKDGESIRGLRGFRGLRGNSGDHGWTPMLAVVKDGERRVHQVAGWFGGTGDAPQSGFYLGKNGFVEKIEEATDLRGAKGKDGVTGIVKLNSPLSQTSGNQQIFILASPSDPLPVVDYPAIAFRPTGTPDQYTMELIQ